MSLPAEKTWTPYSMRPYQRDGVTFLLNHPRAILMWEMGAGKTRTVLSAIDALHLIEPSSTLIVAPKGVAVSQRVWEAEAAEMGLDLSFHLLHGKGLKTLPTPAPDVWVTTFDTLHKPEIQGLLKSGLIQTLVIDELSWLKSYSRRTKSLLRHVSGPSRVWGLTGTPAPNGLKDLFYQVQCIRPDLWGKNRQAWFNQHFDDISPWGDYRTWEPTEKGRYQIYSDLAPFTSRVDDVELPELMVRHIEVPFADKAHLRAYEEMEKQFLIAVDGGEVVAANMGVKSNKLRQIASGFAYTGGGPNSEVRFSHMRLNALRQLREELQGQPLLVFYQFEVDKQLIAGVFDDCRTVLTHATIREWNEGQIPMLVLHPQSAGHGLNLQHGGHHVAWYGLPWSLEQWKQANARLARPGQQESHVTAHVFTTGAIEGKVYDTLCRKEKGQDALLDALAPG